MAVCAVVNKYIVLMSKSVLRDKSYVFAIKVVRFSQFLQAEKNEFILSKQFLRSGTAIGALLREAQYGYTALILSIN